MCPLRINEGCFKWKKLDRDWTVMLLSSPGAIIHKSIAVKDHLNPQTGLAEYNDIFDWVKDLVVPGQASLWIRVKWIKNASRSRPLCISLSVILQAEIRKVQQLFFLHGSDANKQYATHCNISKKQVPRLQRSRNSKIMEMKNKDLENHRNSILRKDDWKQGQHAGATRHHPVPPQECCHQWWCCWPSRTRNEHT